LTDKIIASHHTRAESGSLHRVWEIQTYIDASSHDGEAWIEGPKRFELNDRSLVNYLDQDTFKIVATGEILRRV